LAEELDQHVLHDILGQRGIVQDAGGIPEQGGRLIGVDHRLHRKLATLGSRRKILDHATHRAVRPLYGSGFRV
jgi:hypothetical protein